MQSVVVWLARQTLLDRERKEKEHEDIERQSMVFGSMVRGSA
jgi:hypothetical protein